MLELVGQIVLAYVAILAVRLLINEGIFGLAKVVVQHLQHIPGVDLLIGFIIKREASSFLRQVDSTQTSKIPPAVKIPEKGISHQELLDEMRQLKAQEINPDDGQIFAYVYTAQTEHYKTMEEAYLMFTDSTGISTDDDHEALVREFLRTFIHENALNPIVFPALRRFETETVAMAADMLHGDANVVGSLTTGGTESILMAIKTYRDRARSLFPQIKSPEMVAPLTIHPAFEKAAHYFDVAIVHVDVDADFKADLKKYRQAITSNTILLLASAPQYCHGVVDPIEEIGQIADERGLPFHVDACFGGFMLPWVEKLGYSVPAFDFRVSAVTSISADVHKYGYGLKGASLILYRNAEIRKHQLFAYSSWPGGLFGSPGMTGSRPGGNIAASWAALRSIGQDGYLKMAGKLMEVTLTLQSGIRDIPGLTILGKPHMTAFAFASNDPQVDILALADAMEGKGWKIERQQFPTSVHCSILPSHLKLVDKLLSDLKNSTEEVKGKKARPGTAAIYGMVGNIPDKAIVDRFIKQFLSDVYTCKQ
eukprot:m.310347 g.310347  ORF g.310347 m.310347 type:complete len:537 (+) comp51007_c0_seq1:154-1764(+)